MTRTILFLFRLFCTRWNGVDKAAGTMDALDDKEFTGSLVVLLENGLDFVRTNSKVKWKKTGEERIELPDYPRRSVLEGLVNALIHRQYLDLGSEVHIDIFNRLKYMERRGSGFKKIQSVYQSQYLYTDRLSPQFYSDKENFILTLKNLNYEGAEKGAEKMKIQKMEERKEKILSLIKANTSITQGEIMEKLNLSRKQVQSLMKLLNNQGQIRRIGSNRNGYWEVS